MTLPPLSKIDTLIELLKVYVSPRSVSRSRYYAWKSIGSLWPEMAAIGPPSIDLARNLLYLLIRIK